MLGVVKKILFWRYGRSTWQYDVLCLLILAFIFLTPVRWFENSERRTMLAHQNSSIMLWLAPNEDILEPQEIERRVRIMTKSQQTTVKMIRPQYDLSGKLTAYEVDIR